MVESDVGAEETRVWREFPGSANAWPIVWFIFQAIMEQAYSRTSADYSRSVMEDS